MPYADPEIRRQYHQEWKARNRGRYAERQRATDSSRHANERAERFGVAGRLTIQEVMDLLRNALCVYCGASKRMGLDHVKPMHDGGPNILENIVPSCHACNASKWRQDRPGRWSRAHECCVECGRTEKPHVSHGRCRPCWRQWYKRGRPVRVKSQEQIEHERRLNTLRKRRQRARKRAEEGNS